MPYKSRAIYKEEGKVRDYNLFVIVAEGSKREVEYLMPFDIVDRIKVVKPMSYMPAVGGTKMYLLAESLMSNVGAPRWEKFLKELPHIDVVFDQNGVACIRVNK